MEAVSMGQCSIIKILLEKGAKVHAEKDGRTALDMAKRSALPWQKKREMIRLLEGATSNR